MTGRTSHSVFAAAASALAALALAGCTKNVATGRSQLNLLDRSQEIAMGEEAKGQLTEEYGGKVKDEALQGYVTEVGQRMTPFVEGDYKSLPWEFILLDSDVINAFALPGGKVFMSRGLAAKMTDEAQLAGVLGHEIGHVTAEHADKRISNNLVLQGVVAGAAIGVGGEAGWIAEAIPQVVGQAGQGFLLKFSRDEESEADSLGMRYMSRAGYDPAAQLDVMEILRQASQGGGGSQPEWLSTHPLPETRIKRVADELQKRYSGGGGERAADRFRSRFLARLPQAASKPRAQGAVHDAPPPSGAAYSRYFANRHDPAFCAICGGLVMP